MDFLKLYSLSLKTTEYYENNKKADSSTYSVKISQFVF